MICKSTPWEDHNRGYQVNVKLAQNNWPSRWGATSHWTDVKLPLPNNPLCLVHGRHWVINCNLTLIWYQLDGSCRSCSALGPRDTSSLLGHGYPQHRVLPKGQPDTWCPLAGLLCKEPKSEDLQAIFKKRSDCKVDFYPPLKIQEHWRYRNPGCWNTDDTGALKIKKTVAKEEHMLKSAL